MTAAISSGLFLCAVVGLATAAMGCANDSGGGGSSGRQIVKMYEIPPAVSNAFKAEHPGAIYDTVFERTEHGKPDRYEIGYFNPDRSRGTVTYHISGERIGGA